MKVYTNFGMLPCNVHVANFPFIKTMEDFDFDFQPNVNKKEMLELCNLGFLDNHENILFVGWKLRFRTVEKMINPLIFS